ncbi:hypothetical protein I6G82_09465 [Lysinibacillus macroides]|uniref:Uncharacterized protein n=1 Tax=Lysinibacillus macroides TaxID=33935 RepID=A0A0N0CUT2_9BACI|nr:hypothetical protein [Lysinibacillus macroides]KOY80645.1 hypothetical protein ADM90_15710 [Lysinibacillus macroides]QPR69781.1 hypothetical protein I6G82_09465 [Lysinibacillus macroides]
MNINNLNTLNTFTNNKMNNVVVTVPIKTSLFATVFNDFLKEKSLIITNSNDLNSSLKLHLSEDKVNATVELEDKYCSLCGSMIEDDGSCPLCIVPMFITGNSNQTFQNQHASQANNHYAEFGNRIHKPFRK